jgi:hypothetical protein
MSKLLLLVIAVPLIAQDDVNSILSRLERGRGGGIDRGFLDSSSRYLRGERARLGSYDLARALVLASAYQQLGLAYAHGSYHPGALESYHGALLVLHRLALRHPHDLRARREFLGVAGRIRSLGGVIPLWMTIPGANGQPAPAAPPPPPDSVPAFDWPEIDVSDLPEEERKACNAAFEQYTEVAASAQTALTAMESIRHPVRSQGLSLNSRYVAAESNIKTRMAGARRLIEQRRCADAREPLSIAAEHARRLMRDLGQ